VRPARQTVGAIGWITENTQADAAHEPDVDDLSVAKACGAEVDVNSGRQHEVSPRALVGQEGEHEVL